MGRQLQNLAKHGALAPLCQRPALLLLRIRPVAETERQMRHASR